MTLVRDLLSSPFTCLPRPSHLFLQTKVCEPTLTPVFSRPTGSITSYNLTRSPLLPVRPPNNRLSLTLLTTYLTRAHIPSRRSRPAQRRGLLPPSSPRNLSFCPLQILDPFLHGIVEERRGSDGRTMGEGKGEGFHNLRPLDLGDLRAISVLGRGAKGIVFLVAAHDGRSLALKAISRSNIESKKDGDTGDNYRRIWFERDVLSDLQYPLLPSLHGFVSTDEIVGFAIDRCSGGDLSALRRRQTERMFSEDIIRFYAAELVLVLEHLHGMGVVYRDLKPENILIQDSGHLMLVDFDLSTKLTPRPSPIRTPQKSPKPSDETTGQQKREPRHLHHHRRLLRSWLSCNPKFTAESMEPEEATPDISSHSTSTASSSSTTSSMKSNSFVGTEEYVAPEVIEGTGHDFSVDWWSLGVVLYEMLYGRTPFRGQNRKETFYRILSKAPDLVGEKTALRDLIGKLLEKDPNKRISVEEIKEHEFFRGVDWNSVLEISRPPFIPADDQLDQDEAEEPIDVEKFVRGVYANLPNAKSGSGGGTEEKRKEEESEDTTTNGWYNSTPTPEFLVF